MEVTTHEDHFTIPPMSASGGYSYVDLDRLCEDTLQEFLSAKSPYTYFNTEGHNSVFRGDLGLPENGLQPGTRLLRAKKNLAGIQSEFLYFSPSLSGAPAPMPEHGQTLNQVASLRPAPTESC